MKKILILIIVLTMMTMVACNSNENQVTDGVNNDEKVIMNDEEPEEKVVMDDEKLPVYSKASLSKFNGKDGNPAYVAVDGVVYEVTDVKAWQTPHAGKFEPGRDYSKEINQSPHGKKNLEGLKIVGSYEE